MSAANSQPLILKIAVVLLLVAHVTARIYSDSFTISMFRRSKGWMFLDRMSFDPGLVEVKFSLQVETSSPPKKDRMDLELAMVPDQAWKEEDLIRCERTAETEGAPPAEVPSQPGGVINKPILTTRAEIVLTQANNFTIEKTTHIIIRRPVTYHLVLRDCSKNLINEYFRKETKISYSLEMLNEGKHHGADERSYTVILPGLLLLTAAMVWVAWPGKKSLFVENERDWAKIVLIVALLFNLVAEVLFYMGHLLYAYVSGRQYGFFDFTYLLFHSLSEVMITCLLIFVAYGWTITFVTEAEFDLYIPLISMLGLINLILTLLGKVNDGESDKYHMYDTIPSYLLVFFRVVAVLIMVIGIVKTYSENKSNKRIGSFLIRFSLLGAGYFLSLPAIMIMATWVPPGYQKVMVFVFVELTKNFVNLALTWMLSSKRSIYSTIRADSTSFMEKDNKLL